MKRIYIFSILIIASLASFTFINLDGKWKLDKNKNGIKVYTRTKTGSNFKEYKAEATINASISTIFAVLKDGKNMTKLFPSTLKAEVIKTYSESSYAYYLQLKAPWPVDNRDGVFKNEFSYDKKTKTGYIKGYNSTLKSVQKGFTRIKLISANWTLQYVSPTQTKLTYQAHSNPGGSLPAWLANSSVVDFPFGTLTNLKERVKESQYKNVSFSFMK